MPREIQTFDGVRWTSTKTSLPGHLQGLGALPVPAPSTPIGTAQGVKLKVFQGVAPHGQQITKSQFDVLFVPEIKRLKFELVADPELVVDDNPVWIWKQDPTDRTTWQAIVSSGPFSGLQGDVISSGTDTFRPSFSDTAKLPIALESWTASLRPASGTIDDTELGALRAALRTVAAPLRSLAGDGGTATSAVLAPVPAKAGSTLAILLGGALGLALLAFNTVPRKSK